MEGWTVLTALMAQVPRLRGGTLVTGNSYRHPALLANIAATLDVISGGRVEMGIGVGWWEMEYNAYGFDFPHVSERIYAMEEALQVMQALWTEQRANFAGRFYTITDALCEPKPVQKPTFRSGSAARARSSRCAPSRVTPTAGTPSSGPARITPSCWAHWSSTARSSAATPPRFASRWPPRS